MHLFPRLAPNEQAYETLLRQPPSVPARISSLKTLLVLMPDIALGSSKSRVLLANLVDLSQNFTTHGYSLDTDRAPSHSLMKPLATLHVCGCICGYAQVSISRNAERDQ